MTPCSTAHAKLRLLSDGRSIASAETAVSPPHGGGLGIRELISATPDRRTVPRPSFGLGGDHHVVAAFRRMICASSV
jgi:hypothetical protein